MVTYATDYKWSNLMLGMYILIPYVSIYHAYLLNPPSSNHNPPTCVGGALSLECTRDSDLDGSRLCPGIV